MANVVNGQVVDWTVQNVNSEGILLASGARTVSGSTGDFTLSSGSKLAVYLDVTVVAGTSPALDVKVEAKDPASGKYFSIAAFAQKTAIGNEALFIGNGANFPVRTYRISYVIAGTTPSFTFSVGYSATS